MEEEYTPVLDSVWHKLSILQLNTNQKEYKDIIIWKIKLNYTKIIRCKFMCCSQHFTIYLLLLQNILFFDRRRASFVTLLIYMLDWNSLVYASPLSDISRLSFWKTERLPHMHIPIDFIDENAIFLPIHVIVTLQLVFLFLQIISAWRE